MSTSTADKATSAQQPLPQLLVHDFNPCTFDYSAHRSYQGLPCLADWIHVFRASIPQFQSRAAASEEFYPAERKVRAERFASRYEEALQEVERTAELGNHATPTCISLCALREECLRREGFEDIFKQVKDEENAKALRLLPAVLEELDAIHDHRKRLELLLRGVFAGNIFDLGAASSADLFGSQGAAFNDTRQKLLARPWAVDDLDAVLDHWHGRHYSKALIFVDNAGSDVVLGVLPLARELLGRGAQVVLAANSRPSINDITAPELAEVVQQAGTTDKALDRALAEGCLTVVPSGSELPVLDLRQVSQEVVSAAGDADLVIMIGMGRGIETNLHARFRVDALKLGMIKHKEVAQLLGGRLYDCVCKLSLAA